MNPQLPLTHVQQQILEYIEKSIERTGVSPSYREVMQALGYKSTGSVHRLIEILKQKGHLAQFKPQVWRSFSPLRLKKIEPVEVEGYQRSKPSTFQEPERIVAPDSLSFSLEIIGTITGSKTPELMVETKTLLLPKMAFSHISYHEQTLYGLTIQDSSFLSEYLLPGDIIVVEPAEEDVKSGELVLATTGNESIIGFCFEDEGGFQFKSSPYSNAGLLHKIKRRSFQETQIWGIIHGSMRGFSAL